jgi:hypothetical protein
MPMITETLRGDGLVCLQEFEASDAAETRTFRIGERVRFVGWEQDDNIRDNPVLWLIVFDTGDGKRYAAPQNCFASDECWRGLEKYFTARKAKAATPRKKKVVAKSSRGKKAR